MSSSQPAEAVVTDHRAIRAYLDATSDASKRSRTTTIILVVASVLVLTALLNSLQSHWMLQRLRAFRNIHGQYTETKLGPYQAAENNKPTAQEKGGVGRYEEQATAFSAALAKAYVENALVVRVPFFGISFDVNDLGLLGGLGFLIILGCLRFCISREVDNLRLSMDVSQNVEGRRHFYYLLAMRQMFTVPHTPHINRGRFLTITPSVICWVPLVVYLAVIGHDVQTALIGKELNNLRYVVLLFLEACMAALLTTLSIMVTKRLRALNTLWDTFWAQVRPGNQVGGR
jgi:hypothetical protein